MDEDYIKTLAANDAAISGVMDPVAVDQVASSEPFVEEPSVDTNQPPVEEVNNDREADKAFNFRALREELEYIKEDRDRLRNEFEGYRKQLEQRQPEAPRKRIIDEISDDDLVTGAQLKQSLAEKEKAYQEHIRDQELYLQELKVRSQFSDYDEVTAKYGLPLIENEPDLAQGFLAAQNKAAYLYKIGKREMENAILRQEIEQYRTQTVPQSSSKAEKIVENSRKPGTLSNSVGGSGTLSQVDYLASLSDAEFIKLIEKNLDGV